MTGADRAGGSPSTARSGRPRALLLRSVHHAPDVAVTLLASWTVCYHLALVFGLGLTGLDVLFAAVVAGLAVLPVWRGWVRPVAVPKGTTTGLASVAAVAFAGLSLVLNRPDADDIVYVGRSVAVAELGVMPTRDTVFSTGLYPPVASGFPPVTSWETLLGALARISGLQAGTMVYLVATPVAAALAVLALYRLLVSWRVPAVGLALLAALVFLVEGGTHHASFGNLHVGRIWQGKVVFVAVVVPYLYAVGTDWLRRRSARSLALTVAASVAAVGLTTSAFLVVPLMVGVLVLAALGRRDLRAAAGAGVAAAYPVAAALVSVSVPGATALPPAPALGTAQILAFVLGTGAALVPAVAGLALGWAGANGAGRLVALGSVLVAAAVLAPASLPLLGTATGAGEILWRLAWVTPLPALLGACVSLLATARRSLFWRAAVPGLVLAVLVATGRPLWSSDNAGAALTVPRWKAPEAELVAARQLVAVDEASGRGRPVLAPTSTSYVISLVSAKVHPVVSRGNYMAALAVVPRAEVDERLLLEPFGNGEDSGVPAAEELRGLDKLDVQVACVETGGSSDEVLEQAGWRKAGAAPTCAIFTRPRR